MITCSALNIPEDLLKHRLFVTVIEALVKDKSNSCQEDNIGKLMDAALLLANANTGVNLRWRERLKPELHPSYCHLCNPFPVIWGRSPERCQG